MSLKVSNKFVPLDSAAGRRYGLNVLYTEKEISISTGKSRDITVAWVLGTPVYKWEIVASTGHYGLEAFIAMLKELQRLAKAREKRDPVIIPVPGGRRQDPVRKKKGRG